MRWIKRLYNNRPILAKLLFGKDPEELTYAQAKSFLMLNRLFIWFAVVAFILILIGILQQRGELMSCMSGTPLQTCYKVLDQCVSGWGKVSESVLNISL